VSRLIKTMYWAGWLQDIRSESLHSSYSSASSLRLSGIVKDVFRAALSLIS